MKLISSFFDYMFFCSVAQLAFCIVVSASCVVGSVDEVIESSDSEVEEEDLVDEPAAKRSRRAARDEKRSKAWLKEDEDIVDFLDPSAARKVVGKGFLLTQFCHFCCLF